MFKRLKAFLKEYKEKRYIRKNIKRLSYEFKSNQRFKTVRVQPTRVSITTWAKCKYENSYYSVAVGHLSLDVYGSMDAFDTDEFLKYKKMFNSNKLKKKDIRNLVNKIHHLRFTNVDADEIFKEFEDTLLEESSYK